MFNRRYHGCNFVVARASAQSRLDDTPTYLAPQTRPLSQHPGLHRVADPVSCAVAGTTAFIGHLAVHCL